MKRVEPKSRVDGGYKYLTPGKVSQFRRFMARQDKTAGTLGWNAQRDDLIIEIGLRCGLRREEIQMIDMVDALDTRGHRDDADLLKVIGKGNKERSVPVPSDIRAKLDAFIKLKPRHGESIEDDAPVFVSNKRNRLSLRAINALVAKRFEEAGAGYASPHMLRHTFARWYLTNSENVNRARVNLPLLLGHDKLDTTRIYLQSTLPDIYREIEKLPRG
ncbi:MAG TPA: tyrosine-type recombinase/integrase [Nitrospirota bacterium]